MAFDKPTTPIGPNDQISTGQYYVTLAIDPMSSLGALAYAELYLVKGVNLPLPGIGKTIRVNDFDLTAGILQLDVSVIENPFPVAAFVTGLAILLGLGIVAYSLHSISKVVENSPEVVSDIGNTVISVGFLIVLIVVVWIFRGKIFS